jgi:choline dehydrogenase-like flavoprotein
MGSHTRSTSDYPHGGLIGSESTLMIRNSIPACENGWDLCIVGSGPVGMAMAMEFDRLGRDVLVLESGGREVDPQRAEEARAILLSPQTHAPMEIATCRALGGASWTWGGRSVPFDPIDLEDRPWVPHAEWPISLDDFLPWHARAAEYLLCGSDCFVSRPPRLAGSHGDLDLLCVERWATESRLALIHRSRIEGSARIELCVNSTVVDLEFNPGRQRVEGLVVAGPAGRTKVRARQIVLAMGGVETTRLLLGVQRRLPQLFGGPDGALGRFYMGHISGKVADITFARPEYIADFDFEKDATESFVRRRMVLTREAQREHRLLNTAFWPDNPPFYDYRHRSGVLSAVFLALSFPPVGRRILPEGIRRAHVGPKPHHYGAHLRNAILGAGAGSRDVLNILRDRFLGKPRKPGFLVRNSGGKYALHYHGEQEPNPESRVTLSEEQDRFGMPRAAVDLRFTEGDVRSVIGSHRVLDRALRASGIGLLEYRYPEKELAASVRFQAADGYHQAGTTRMGRDPRSSVVDPNLQVHGVENLHIASSSVFPTSGQANSTFPAVALALRLAHRLNVAPGRSRAENSVFARR